MAARNKTCKQCAKKYHYCCSCDWTGYEDNFCCPICLLAYREKYLPSVLAEYGLTRERLESLMNDIRIFNL